MSSHATPLVLYIDTYVVSGSLPTWDYRAHPWRMYKYLAVSKSLKLRPSTKYDIFRFTLASYSQINFDYVFINYSLESEHSNQNYQSLDQYITELFPAAVISHERSDTPAKFFSFLDNLNIPDDSWVFFSPNNDHPFIGSPSYFNSLVSHINAIIPNLDTDRRPCILYSHFTESVNDLRPTDPKWGYYSNNFKSVIYEDRTVVACIDNKDLLDSIKIFKYSDLLFLFSQYKTLTTRCVRLEDLPCYSSGPLRLLTFQPTEELCHHYDSYTHLIDHIRPLQIPLGFFDSRIHIAYGYDSNIPQCLNIHPLRLDADLTLEYSDIPPFILSRTSKILIADHFKSTPQLRHQSRILRTHVYPRLPHIYLLRSFIKLCLSSLHVYIFPRFPKTLKASYHVLCRTLVALRWNIMRIWL